MGNMDAQEYTSEAVGNYLLRMAEGKARRYITDPSEAPEGADVEEGPQGGLYYDTESLGPDGEDSGEVTTPAGGSMPDAQEAVAEAVVGNQLETNFESQEQAAELADHLAENLPENLPEGAAESTVYDEMSSWLNEQGIAENFEVEEAENLAADIAETWSSDEGSDTSTDTLRDVSPGETVSLATDKGTVTVTVEELDENVTGTSDSILYGETRDGTRVGIPSEDVRSVVSEGAGSPGTDDPMEETVINGVFDAWADNQVGIRTAEDMAAHLTENLDEDPSKPDVYDAVSNFLNEEGIAERVSENTVTDMVDYIHENLPDGEESDGGSEEGNEGSTPASEENYWAAELATNPEYSEGNQISVDAERGSVSGTVDEYNDEYGELFIVDEEGREHRIPVDDIEGIEG